MRGRGPGRELRHSPRQHLLPLHQGAEQAVQAALPGVSTARPGWWEHRHEASSPKKGDIPSHRRQQPAALMACVLLATLLLGLLTILLHTQPTFDSGLTPDIARTAKQAATPAAGSTLVEFAAPGLWVPLRDALDLSFPLQPGEQPLLQVTLQQPTQGTAMLDTRRAQQAGSAGGTAASAHAPGTGGSGEGIHLLVAVPSACCSQLALQRRAAVRRTWAALAKQRFPSAVDVKFFLAQPANASELQAWLPAIAMEVQEHNDTVVVRGADTYNNLPNKVFGFFRYSAAHPAGYTHTLKSDDDTWVRMHRLMSLLADSSLRDPLPEGPPLSPLALERSAQLKAELDRMSHRDGKPLVSDGMALYDASLLVKAAQKKAAISRVDSGSDVVIDDIDGSALTLSQLMKRAGAGEAAASQQVQLQEQRGASAVAAGVQAGQRQDSGELHRSSIRPQFRGVYLGAVEVQSGFVPIRDPRSKWFISEEMLPNELVPWGARYVGGWGYVLSNDLVLHVVQKVNLYRQHPELTPAWFQSLPWEDVLVGLLLSDVAAPRDHPAFRPPWRSCSPSTAVRHLDVDSPRLLAGLMEQELSGLGDQKPVQCSSGAFVPGEYSGWRAWRDSLSVARL